MIAIVGLGNPGKEYQNTLHNVGFLVIDKFKESWNQQTDYSKKFNSFYQQIQFQDRKIILLKPQTYMNKSGIAVVSCIEYFKIKPENTIVIHDDLDLPAGMIRYKQSGGHGGHNGIRDIIQHLNSNQFQRIKIGIGRPQQKEMVASYVLGKIPLSISQQIDDAIDETIEKIKQLITQN